MKTTSRLAGWKSVAAVVGVWAFASVAWAGPNWITAGPGNWNDTSNWNPAVLPTASDGWTIIGSNGAVVTVNDGGRLAQFLRVQSNSVLHVTTNGSLGSAALQLFIRENAEMKIDGGLFRCAFLSLDNTSVNTPGTSAKLTISGTANLEGSGGLANSRVKLWIGSSDGKTTGTVYQTGGTNTVVWDPTFNQGPYFAINNAGSSYNLLGGTLNMLVGLRVSDFNMQINGAFNYGDAAGTGQLNELGSSYHYASSTIQQHVGIAVYSNGVFRGHGSVFPSLYSYARTTTNYQPLVNYGKIIADGYGTDRELSFPNFSSDKGGVQGGTNTSDKGWYAVNRGKLTLGALTVGTSSTNAVTWGDTVSQTNLTLVNSFRAAFSGLSGNGALTASLLATNRTDIPALSALQNHGTVVGIWSNSVSGFTFSSANLTLRYDSTGLSGPLYTPELMRVYANQGASWMDITSGIADTNSRLAYAQSGSTLSSVAVVLRPPPSGTVIAIR